MLYQVLTVYKFWTFDKNSHYLSFLVIFGTCNACEVDGDTKP